MLFRSNDEDNYVELKNKDLLHDSDKKIKIYSYVYFKIYGEVDIPSYSMLHAFIYKEESIIHIQVEDKLYVLLSNTALQQMEDKEDYLRSSKNSLLISYGALGITTLALVISIIFNIINIFN